jgi:DNA-binding GntR family transcriptional regulator
MFTQVTHDERVDKIDPDAPEPLYEQLAAVLREQIRSGRIPPRRVLPSNRTLTQEYGVARGTAARAVAILIEEGWAYTVPGRGVYSVAEPDRPQPGKS